MEKHTAFQFRLCVFYVGSLGEVWAYGLGVRICETDTRADPGVKANTRVPSTSLFFPTVRQFLLFISKLASTEASNMPALVWSAGEVGRLGGEG